MDAKLLQSYQVKRVPPESGWGYLIAIGMALPFICALSSMPSFGLMFGDFLKNLGEETSAIALVTSCFFSAFSFAGLFTNILFKKMSVRFVGVIGAAMYFTGSLMTVFVSSVEQLLFSFSILQGAGFGIIIPVAYSTFNAYFVEKRVPMMSLAQSLIGVGTMIYPILVEYLMSSYGFRGAMAILAAINGHAIFGMLVMHPVEWHLKKIKIPVTKRESILLASRKQSMNSTDVKIVVVDADEGETKSMRHENFNHLFVEKRNSLNVVLAKELLSSKSASLDPMRVEDDFRRTDRRASSISSLGNWTGAVVVSDVNGTLKKNEMWQTIVDFLDLTLLNDSIYLNIVLGLSFALYSDMAFFTLQPMYLFEIGYSKSETAFIISAGAAADLASRLCLAVASLFIQVKARNVYLSGAVLTIVSRFFFLSAHNYPAMLIVTCVMGFLRTWLHVPLPLVFAEYLSAERFPSGYGLFMFLQGNITFIIGPFIGWIRDVTGSYEISFHCLTFAMALCAIPWIIEIIFNEFHRKYKTVITK